MLIYHMSVPKDARPYYKDTGSSLIIATLLTAYMNG